MAKTKTTPKYELAQLDANNVVELDGWKSKQETIVKENPFIEIVDNETYQTAKTRRTALVSARTTIQNQDKTIASVVSKFRKGTMEIAKKLIDITEPHEQKQQSEVSRYEAILEAKRNEIALKEEKRIESIKKQLEETKGLFNMMVHVLKLETVEDTKSDFEKWLIEHNFDYEEFEPMFDEIVSEAKLNLENKIGELEIQETNRLEQLKRDQESEMNRRSVLAQQIIDSTNEDPKNLISSIERTFEKEFDFGDFQNQVNENYRSFIVKAENKIKAIETELARRKEIEIQENKDRINNVREGLLDKVFQLSVDNYIDDFNYISEALQQENPFPELEVEFKKMIDVVQKNLDQKMEVLNSQMEQKRRDEEAEEKRMEAVMTERTKVIESLGMVRQEIENGEIWTGYGLTFDVSEIYEAESITDITDEIEDFKSQVEEIAKRKESREKQLLDLGLIKHEQSTEDLFDGFGVEVFELTIEAMLDEEWIGFVEEIKTTINNFKENDVLLKKRQESMAVDKAKMINLLVEHNENLFTDYSWKDKETLDLWETIQSEYTVFMNSRIEKINKF